MKYHEISKVFKSHITHHKTYQRPGDFCLAELCSRVPCRGAGSWVGGFVQHVLTCSALDLWYLWLLSEIPRCWCSVEAAVLSWVISHHLTMCHPRISWVSALSIDARFCLLLDEDASSDAIRKLEVEIELRRCLSWSFESQGLWISSSLGQHGQARTRKIQEQKCKIREGTAFCFRVSFSCCLDMSYCDAATAIKNWHCKWC